MKLIPIVLVFAVAYVCGGLKEKLQTTSSPSPTPLTQVMDPPLVGEPPASNETPPPIPLGRTVSGGVLNGKAKSMPQPDYPPAARAVRASGAVSVQVLVDEKGKVVSATAVSGHALLRSASEQAARQVEFEPTILSGHSVKVSGVLTYSFKP